VPRKPQRQLHDELRAAIRAAGLRVTKTRLAVLAALAATDGARSHGELMRELAEEHERTTVFRALGALTRTSLVRRVDLGDRIWRYRHAGISDDPRAIAASFVCTNCGAIEELRRLELAMTRPPRAIVRREIEVLVQGRCNDCSP
jgi:Fe2+ or Zn2+ uptake regulation protein